MKLARFRIGQRQGYGAVEEDRVREITGDVFGFFQVTARSHPLGSVTLLAPCLPSKILAVALNYQSHLGEATPSPHPEIFLKAPSSLIGPEAAIVLPKEAGRVDYEGELVVVIGKPARRVSPEQALDYVLGYTGGVDVSARDWQRGDLQWWRAKSADTFSPLGPWIATDLDPSDLHLELRLNGQVRQSSRTALLIHSVPHIISFVSQAMTLLPGDVIFTGTPGTTAPLTAGDVVEVEIEGIGCLRNRVAADTVV